MTRGTIKARSIYSISSDGLARAGYRAASQFRVLLLLSLLTVTVSGTAISASVVYTYDTLGRLATATYSTGVVITYAYDAAGNRTSHVTTGAP